MSYPDPKYTGDFETLFAAGTGQMSDEEKTEFYFRQDNHWIR